MRFCSVDSEIENLLSADKTSPDDIKIKELFQNILVGEENEKKTEDKEDVDTEEKKADDKDEKDEKKEEEKTQEKPFNEISNAIGIEIGKLKSATAPAYFKVDEQMKRFRNMADQWDKNKPSLLRRP